MTTEPRAADLEVAGVPLSLYAAVLGYLGEGMPIEASVVHAGLTLEEWPGVEAAWSERLALDTLEGGALIAACDEIRLAAGAEVARPLSPLDEDLGAFLDFFRLFSASEDPIGFLGERGLVENDLFRLLAIWQPRMNGGPEDRERVAGILAAPPGVVPAVKAGAPAFKTPPRPPLRPKPAPDVAAAAGAPVTLPKPVSPSPLGRTSLAMPDLSKLALPFIKSDPAAAPPPSQRSGPFVPQPARVGTQSPLGRTSLAMDLPIKQALPFGPGAAPPAPPAPAPPAPAPPAPALPPPSAPAPPPPSAPLPPPVPPPRAPLPPPAPPPRVSALPKAALPVVAPKKPELSGTSLSTFEPVRPAMPFQPGARPASPPAAQVQPQLPVPIKSPLTGTSLSTFAPAGPALPFQQGGPAAPEPRLTLAAYAGLLAEISHNPAAAMATLARHGMTPDGKRAEDAAWQARFAAEPALRMAWLGALKEAGERLGGKK